MRNMGIFREGFLVRFFLIALAGFTVAIVASARAAEGVDQLGYCSSADKVVSFARLSAAKIEGQLDAVRARVEELTREKSAIEAKLTITTQPAATQPSL